MSESAKDNSNELPDPSSVITQAREEGCDLDCCGRFAQHQTCRHGRVQFVGTFTLIQAVRDESSAQVQALRDEITTLKQDIVLIRQDRDAQFAHNRVILESTADLREDNRHSTEQLARLQGILDGTGTDGIIKGDIEDTARAVMQRQQDQAAQIRRAKELIAGLLACHDDPSANAVDGATTRSYARAFLDAPTTETTEKKTP